MKKSTLALVVMGIVALWHLHLYRLQKYIIKTVINWMSMAKLKPCII